MTLVIVLVSFPGVYHFFDKIIAPGACADFINQHWTQNWLITYLDECDSCGVQDVCVCERERARV